MDKFMKIMLEDLGLAIVGFSFMMLSAITTLHVPAELSLLFFIIGPACTTFACIDFLRTIWKDSGKKPSLKTNVSGIAWIWAVAGLTIVFTPFVYWAVSYPWNLLFTAITRQYTFTGIMGGALMFVSGIVITYLCTFVLLFVVIWSLVNAKATGS